MLTSFGSDFTQIVNVTLGEVVWVLACTRVCLTFLRISWIPLEALLLIRENRVRPTSVSNQNLLLTWAIRFVPHAAWITQRPWSIKRPRCSCKSVIPVGSMVTNIPLANRWSRSPSGVPPARGSSTPTIISRLSFVRSFVRRSIIWITSVWSATSLRSTERWSRTSTATPWRPLPIVTVPSLSCSSSLKPSLITLRWLPFSAITSRTWPVRWIWLLVRLVIRTLTTIAPVIRVGLPLRRRSLSLSTFWYPLLR